MSFILPMYLKITSLSFLLKIQVFKNYLMEKNIFLLTFIWPVYTYVLCEINLLFVWINIIYIVEYFYSCYYTDIYIYVMHILRYHIHVCI